MLNALNALGCMSHCSALELGDQTQAGSSGTVQGGQRGGKKQRGQKAAQAGIRTQDLAEIQAH